MLMDVYGRYKELHGFTKLMGRSYQGSGGSGYIQSQCVSCWRVMLVKSNPNDNGEIHLAVDHSNFLGEIR